MTVPKTVFALLGLIFALQCIAPAQRKHFVVVNDDSFPTANSATFYRIG